MNYITITEFMVSDLNLRGNELIVYALIYGFSQDESSDFHGSLNYIQKRTGLSRPTVVEILKKLTKKNLINKEKKEQKCLYFTSKETLLPLVKKLNPTSKETLPQLVKKLNHPSIYIKDDIKREEKRYSHIFEIIEYLNKKTNSNFRTNAKSNTVNISARLSDGYSVVQLKKIIDTKAKDWLGTEFEKYLCPETLFRPSNVEKYLNQVKNKKDNTKNSSNLIENEIFNEE